MMDYKKPDRMIDELEVEEPTERIINLRRRELVWEERECQYKYSDFEDWKACYKTFLTGLAPSVQPVIDKLEELTFDIVCDYIAWSCGVMDYSDEADEELNTLFDSFVVKVEGHTFDLLDAAQQDIREMNWDCDICNTDYADDYDEEWSVKKF